MMVSAQATVFLDMMSRRFAGTDILEELPGLNVRI